MNMIKAFLIYWVFAGIIVFLIIVFDRKNAKGFKKYLGRYINNLFKVKEYKNVKEAEGKYLKILLSIWNIVFIVLFFWVVVYKSYEIFKKFNVVI